METKHRIENVTSLDQLPLILKLNKNAEPLGWISYEECAIQYSKNNILWSLGSYEVVLRGGTNAITGERSKLILDTIVAVDNGKSPFAYKKAVPTLTNSALFMRDAHLCAYCGNQFGAKHLTRDHVHPRSRGGLDIWDNVVTSCKPCNSKKDDHLLTEIGMELLYIPYTINYHESLILANRRILADQMDYLLRGVNKNSRLHTTH